MKKTGLALQITAGIVSAMLLVTSCTMQKRIYRPGYHIEWVKAKNSPDKQIANINTKKDEESKVTKTEQLKVVNNTMNNSFDPTLTDNSIIASVDNRQIAIQKDKKFSLNSDYRLLNKKQNPLSFKHEFKKGTKTISASAEGPKTNIWALLSFISGILGLFSILLLYFGALALIAVVYSIIGLVQINENPSEWKGKGFAIAGLVLGIIGLLGWLILLLILLSI